MAKQFRFNLLIKKEKAVFAEAVSFLNSYAKYVIVLTQIMVLVVFFVKIILDQTVIDLKETIDQKNQIILTAKEMIDNNNVLARKLAEVALILETNDYRYQTLSSILTHVPDSIKVNSIRLQKQEIVLDGESSNANDIQRMQLKLSETINQPVSIKQLNKKQNVFYFKLKITNENKKG